MAINIIPKTRKNVLWCFSCTTILAIILAFVILFIFTRHVRHPIPVQELYFMQHLDHFSSGPNNKVYFNQRFSFDASHWGGAGRRSPIFIYLGGSHALEDAVGQIGILTELAKQYRGMIMYLEHRFYGNSVPFGPIDNATEDVQTRGYLRTSQAIADYARLIVSFKANMSAEGCPVVVFGASYGGMLATWLVIKYQQIAVGALASSAPINLLYSNDTSGLSNRMCSAVGKRYEEASKPCHDAIVESWLAIDAVASQLNGLQTLSAIFKTCSTLTSADELKLFLARIYISVVKYDDPSSESLEALCSAITDSDMLHQDILVLVSEAVFATVGTEGCLVMSVLSVGEAFFGATNPQARIAWNYQLCTELVLPIGCQNETMLPLMLFDLKTYMGKCQQLLGEVPQDVGWNAIEYGGKDLNPILANSAAQMIFSNGKHDPISTVGILEDISKTAVALYTENGTHALDMRPMKPDDPKWLKSQRNKEMEIIGKWINSASRKLSPSFSVIFVLIVVCVV